MPRAPSPAPLLLPLLVSTWVFSLVALALAAYLVNSGHQALFPGPEGRRITVEGVFAFFWIVLCSSILIVARLVRSSMMGFGSTFVTLFIGFLISVAGMGSISAVINLSGVHERYSIWKAYEGFGWIAVFSTLFTAAYASWKHLIQPVEVHKSKEQEANAPLVV